MTKLIFTPPTADTPGYLRRARRGLEIHTAFKGNPTVQALDDMIDFLIEFVTEPADPKKAKELLWEASENEIETMLTTLWGGSEDTDPLADTT
jgi:hypothetical protein